MILVAAGVLAAIVAGGAALVRSSWQRHLRANDVVPGVTTRAPRSWAGAHTAQARLHRRLRDAVRALRANPALDDPWMIEHRVRIEQQALAIDDRLVAAAALPLRLQAEPLAAAAGAVDALEAAVASLVSSQPALEAPTALEAAIAEVEQRVALLGEGGAEGLQEG
ncbi:MAG TPA: hypothetical protein VFJ85_18625 [Acidimicrobiales bacterium]|nr:hypothetical protein [Acidimicrobiales bacterium]